MASSNRIIPRCTGKKSFQAVSTALLLGAIGLAGGCAAGKAHPLRPPTDSSMLVSVESLDEGRIRVRRAGRKLLIDLARDISGCTGRAYDHTVNEEYEASVGFEIVDETEKAPYTYVVLLASAPPNCNVQGQCGAGGPDTTLIWLKLTRGLSLAAKQAFAIDDCRANRYAKIAREDDSEDGYVETQAKDLTWNGDTLQIEFEEGDETSIRRLVYDRRNPEMGFQ